MKTYKENEIREHNYYYGGASSKRKKHGQGKPGTSRQEKITSRFARIRYDEKDFVPFGYIDIKNIHKARLEALEHEVKATLAMENLYLSEEQEKLLQSYADGEISFKEFQEQILKITEDNKVA